MRYTARYTPREVQHLRELHTAHLPAEHMVVPARSDWVRQAEIDAGRGRPGALTTDEREELARLRRDVKRLQMSVTS